MQFRSVKSVKEGRPLEIRVANPDDASRLLEYVETISGQTDFLTFGPGEFQMSESEERKFLASSDSADNQVFLLAIIDQTIVGVLHFFAAHRPRVRHTGEFGMSVLKEHWGNGVGSAMIDSLFEWARATELIRKINLRVRTDNHRAISLYLRKGFVVEGTLSREIYVDGQFFDHYWMGCKIS